MKKLLFFAAMASALISSCDRNEQEEILPASAELRFVNVATMDVLTRAGGQSAYGSDICINMPTTAVYVTPVSKVLVSNQDGAWSLASPIYLSPANRDLTVWGPSTLSPKSADNDNLFVLTSAKYDVAQDLVYQKTTQVNSGKAAVELLLEHAYTKLTFKFATTNYFDAGILKALSVNGVSASADFNIADGSIANPVADGAVQLVTDGVAPFVDQSALVVPMAAAVLKISCTIDGLDYTNIAIPDITALNAGTEYVVSLELKGRLMQVSKVEVKDWHQETTTVPIN